MATLATTVPGIRRAKLQRPRLGADIVVRARLEDRLTRSLGYPLAVVSGPPGSGKTTLVSHWLESLDVPSVWLALDERDAKVDTFAGYLLAALRPFLAASVTEPLAYLRHAGEVDARTLGDLLGDALLDLPGELVVVLDDAQVLAGGPVMPLLAALLEYPAPRLHLVLVTRQEPELPLARLRARGQLVELRAEDLAFSEDESRAFLRQAAGDELSAADVHALSARTEGWAAGLRLAALALRRRSVAEVVLGLGHGREIDELIDEVLDRIPERHHAFVLAATLPERASASLCAALLDDLDDATCADLLEQTVRANGYLTRVGVDGWFRYHQLFREVIARRRARLCPAAYEAELHRRASSWFERHGEVEEAVRHALASGDPALAGEIVERQVHPALNGDDWTVVQRWLAILPATLVDTRPGLLLARGWIAVFRAAIAEIPGLVARAEALLDAAEDPARRGEAAGLRAVVAAIAEDAERTSASGDIALRLMPAEWQAARGVVALRVAAMIRGSGAVESSLRYAASLLGERGVAWDGFTLRLQTGLAVEHIFSGELARAVSVLPGAAAESEASRRSIVAGMARAFLGLALSLRGELGAAIESFARVYEQRHVVNLFNVIDSGLGLAHARALSGDSLAAQGALDALSTVLVDIGVTTWDAELASMRARVALLAGDLVTALTWLDGWDIAPPVDRMMAFEQPSLTAARARIARGTAEDLERARALLAESLAHAERGRNVPQALEVGVLLAMAHARAGAQDEARALLERQLPLAARSGIVRPFLEAGEPGAALLRAQRARSATPYVIDWLLAACGAREVRPITARSGSAAPPERIAAAGLTDREREVLQGLVDRLTNKEIAERLGISPETVKYHAASIYLKLGVGSRRAAAMCGIELGLVPASGTG